jgi:hypothetical protein
VRSAWSEIPGFFSNLFNEPKAVIESFISWVGGKMGALIAPFQKLGDVVGGAFSKIGGLFKRSGRDSGESLNEAFAGGIQNNTAAPAAAFNDSLQGIRRQMPHSDAQEGPLSQLTSSGRALTDTFASGMDDSALREKAEIVFSAAMPKGEGAAAFPYFEQQERETSSPPSITIQNLYLQAEDCQNLFDFIRVIMQAVHQPMEAPV